MRTLQTFRPTLDRVESRILTTAGLVVHPAAVHHAINAKSPHHPPAEIARPTDHKAVHVVGKVASTSTAVTIASPPRPAPVVVAPVIQSWVKLVNMTGEDLAYQISFSPYKHGQFQPFAISAYGSNSVQYQMTSVVNDANYAPAKVQIEFGNGQVTTLNTGPSQSSAQGYYIFLDSNLQYYVAPFISSQASY